MSREQLSFSLLRFVRRYAEEHKLEFVEALQMVIDSAIDMNERCARMAERAKSMGAKVGPGRVLVAVLLVVFLFAGRGVW